MCHVLMCLSLNVVTQVVLALMASRLVPDTGATAAATAFGELDTDGSG